MGKGGYHGGSTVVGRNSGWFTDTAFVPSPKPMTTKQLIKIAKKDAKKARRQQAANEEFIASIQGLPSTITLGPTENKRRKKRKKGSKR